MLDILQPAEVTDFSKCSNWHRTHVRFWFICCSILAIAYPEMRAEAFWIKMTEHWCGDWSGGGGGGRGRKSCCVRKKKRETQKWGIFLEWNLRRHLSSGSATARPHSHSVHYQILVTKRLRKSQNPIKWRVPLKIGPVMHLHVMVLKK